MFDPAVISGVVSHPAVASVKQSSGSIEESLDEKTSDDSSGTARVSEIQASFVAPVLDPGSESSPTISSDGTEISLSTQVENDVIDNDSDHDNSTNEDVSLLLVIGGTALDKETDGAVVAAEKSTLIHNADVAVTSAPSTQLSLKANSDTANKFNIVFGENWTGSVIPMNTFKVYKIS